MAEKLGNHKYDRHLNSLKKLQIKVWYTLWSECNWLVKKTPQ